MDGFAPKWGSSEVRIWLFTDHFQRSRSRNAAAFCILCICIGTSGRGLERQPDRIPLHRPLSEKGSVEIQSLFCVLKVLGIRILGPRSVCCKFSYMLFWNTERFVRGIQREIKSAFSHRCSKKLIKEFTFNALLPKGSSRT